MPAFILLQPSPGRDHTFLGTAVVRYILSRMARTIWPQERASSPGPAIHRAAGPELLEECRHLSGCETGKAKMTKAYKLPCDYVIHTPGPVWRGGQKKERERLASCYRSCLELAVKNGIRSIAFPSISTGIYGFPIDEAAKIAVETSKAFVSEHPGELDVIKWVLFDDITFAAYKDAIEK